MRPQPAPHNKLSVPPEDRRRRKMRQRWARRRASWEAGSSGPTASRGSSSSRRA